MGGAGIAPYINLHIANMLSNNFENKVAPHPTPLPQKLKSQGDEDWLFLKSSNVIKP